MKKLGVCLIGCGSVSKTHLDAIIDSKYTNIISLVDKDLEKVKVFAKKYSCEFYDDYKKILNDERIHVVHITTPHHEHVNMAVELAKRGKHLLIEKPLANNYLEAKKMCDEINKTKVKASIVFQNRFNPTIVKLKKIINNNKYGKLLGLKGVLTWNRKDEYYLKSLWRGDKVKEGGGVLINQSIHTLDILQWLGGEIEYLKGSISNHDHGGIIETEDTAEAFFIFKNGAKGVFYATNNYSFDSSVEIEAHCENGILNIKNNKLKLVRVEEDLILERDFIKKNLKKEHYGNSHYFLINEFYKNILFGEGEYIPLKEGLKAQKIIERLYE